MLFELKSWIFTFGLLKMCFSFFQSATIFIYSFHRVNINLVYAIANNQPIHTFCGVFIFPHFIWIFNIYNCFSVCIWFVVVFWLHVFLHFNWSIRGTVRWICRKLFGPIAYSISVWKTNSIKKVQLTVEMVRLSWHFEVWKSQLFAYLAALKRSLLLMWNRKHIEM